MSIPPDLIETLRRTRRLLVLTGAGASAESGIPTFRDALTGLWSRFDAKSLATPEAFAHDPDLVWGWYEWRRMKALKAAPNAGHRAIAALADRVPRLTTMAPAPPRNMKAAGAMVVPPPHPSPDLGQGESERAPGAAFTVTLVTQNVDDLHERAGSPAVLHLHGSLNAPRCARCARPYDLPPGLPDEPEGGRRLAPPRCRHCAGPIRPGVVWFGESLVPTVLAAAEAAARDCDLCLAVGTSSLVYPAAALPERARAAGATLVQVNPSPTPLDGSAHHNLRGTGGAVLPALLAAVWPG